MTKQPAAAQAAVSMIGRFDGDWGSRDFKWADKVILFAFRVAKTAANLGDLEAEGATVPAFGGTGDRTSAVIATSGSRRNGRACCTVRGKSPPRSAGGACSSRWSDCAAVSLLSSAELHGHDREVVTGYCGTGGSRATESSIILSASFDIDRPRDSDSSLSRWCRSSLIDTLIITLSVIVISPLVGGSRRSGITSLDVGISGCRAVT